MPYGVHIVYDTDTILGMYDTTVPIPIICCYIIILDRA